MFQSRDCLAGRSIGFKCFKFPGFEVKNGRPVPVIEGVVVLQRDEAALLDAYGVSEPLSIDNRVVDPYTHTHVHACIHARTGLHRAEGGEGRQGPREEGDDEQPNGGLFDFGCLADSLAVSTVLGRPIHHRSWTAGRGS